MIFTRNFDRGSNRVVRKLQFRNNFLLKTHFCRALARLARKNARFVREPIGFPNKSNTERGRAILKLFGNPRVFRSKGCGTAPVLALLLLFAVGMVLPAQQQSDGPLRINQNDAVALAMRNNLALESARINTATSKRASDLAWNQFIPSVDAGGVLMRLNKAPSAGAMGGIMDMMNGIGTQMGLPNFPLPPTPPTPQWMLRSSLSASLAFNFAMLEDMNKLRLDYELGMISYGKARSQLERDTRKAYHNILLIKENIALLYGSLENADRQVRIAQANFNAGLAPELNLLQAQVARENLRPVIDQAEGGMRLLMMQFSMFLGLPHDTEFELEPVSPGISPIPLETMELIGKATAGQPDILELRQNIVILDSIRKSNRLRLFTPMLSLSWNADPSFQGDPLKDGWFGSEPGWAQSSGAFVFSVGFRLNGLLPFGAERQGLASLDDKIRTTHIGLAQMIRGTEIEINNLVLTLQRIQITMGALEQTAALAQRSFDLTEQAYRAGFVDLFQVQNAEQSLRQARVQLHEQQFNYLNGLIDLEYALGLPFGTMASNGSPTSTGSSN